MTTKTQSHEFESMLRQYADLAIQVGLNLQPGQRLLVRGVGSIESIAPFVRHITKAAYQAGAEYVDVIWTDLDLDLIRVQNAAPDSLNKYPQWPLDGLMEYGERGDAILSILAINPDLFAGQDTELVTLMHRARAKRLRPYTELIFEPALNWLIVCVPEPEWARKVFPHLPSEAQIPSLWQAIFKTVRLYQPDPIAAWQEHVNHLVARAEYLTQKRYRALKLSGPGTDLTIGLAERHLWGGGQVTSRGGITFVPNLPTEEVFTLPHRELVDGVVRASKPLSYGGVLIEDFSLTFRQGRVVGLAAGRGEVALRKLIETDEGAGRLGEVALVPHSSPISQAGHLFYDTLFDENAACHLALGDGLRFGLQGGKSMTTEEFLAQGGNDSVIHIDFMIGSDELDVDGITSEDTSEAVMRAGEWAFDL